MNLALSNFLFIRNVILEFGAKCSFKIYLEDENHNNGRKCGYPIEGIPAQL
jgi:hypothetical protein